jgi:hypothetical protein
MAARIAVPETIAPGFVALGAAEAARGMLGDALALKNAMARVELFARGLAVAVQLRSLFEALLSGVQMPAVLTPVVV